jgi:hypothetical protein
MTTVDFRNSTATRERGAGKPPMFRNGVFEEWMPLIPSWPVEWRYEIVQDITVHPDLQTAIRFVEMFKEHLAETGSFEYLAEFRRVDSISTVKECGLSLFHLPACIVVSLHGVGLIQMRGYQVRGTLDEPQNLMISG